MRVRALDDHISRRIDIDARGLPRVRLHEPDDDGDVVGYALEDHRDCTVDLQEVHGSAVVVSEGRRLRLQRGELSDCGDQMLPD